MIHKSIVSFAATALLCSFAKAALADAPAEERGFNPLPEHHFQWAPSDVKHVQAGLNFGLMQLALGGFNIAGEVRYRRLWLEYSHGERVDWIRLRPVSGYAPPRVRLTRSFPAQRKGNS